MCDIDRIKSDIDHLLECLTTDRSLTVQHGSMLDDLADAIARCEGRLTIIEENWE